MTHIARPLSALAAALLAMASLPALALEPFKADYQASYMGMQANGLMTLASEGNNRWRYSLSIKNQVADLSQSTVFEEKGGQLRPLSSDDRSLFLIKKKAVTATYDWSTAQATWAGDVKPDRRGPVKLQQGDMDALLINLAIARDVNAGKTPSYRMVDEGRAKPMTYKVAGKEAITVNGKSEQATKVSRSDGSKEIIAWIVPDMPVPVRILQRENGQDALDLTIKTLH
ncbi:DUF3108 domain-containing protein [Xanthomonas translucens]|uniref:DUF3108 domain-containing protein n=1 Tax=Xanthomonas campestris pv. translucens TaxID=343 RepID=UPI0002A7B7C0|nr:DUF3108 domain-containing protein [Xanthomonas translucens]AKK68352.1 hypothetical protein FD63_13100 [Xanthomonas translucens pv. undulosa]AVY66154.1 hypothetical protein NZ30_07350 [Xanthomonas translucens pv. undulosa]ELQ12683.1 hypothetical protein A989_06443 [Xanthomonas translucens DAR61454]MBC3970906.1 DUF3108 domain-containing protein [Xanthomonas translucens pv. undulosa]MCT8271244.1 DUF3108 domain-containing protein [Xanthomonas translucens pv. undulosa]